MQCSTSEPQEQEQIKCFTVSHCLCKKVSWWILKFIDFMCLVYKETTLCDYVNKLVNLTSSMKETVQKYQFTGGEKLSDFPIDWRSGLQVILLEIMFSLLHRPIVSLHKTSIYCQEPWIIIVCCLYTLFWLIKCQWPLTCILWITRTTVSAKNLYCSTEENKLNLGWPEGE